MFTFYIGVPDKLFKKYPLISQNGQFYHLLCFIKAKKVITCALKINKNL